jgi:GDPmannose 4,6-dehydratase
MTRTALITGITGQDGSHLADFLLEKGYRIVGMIRRSSAENLWRIEQVLGRIELVQGDVLDGGSLVRILSETKPDEIYNLAAMSFVPTSFGQPVLTGEYNALGVTRMLEAMRLAAPRARFYQASSSEMFGKVRETPQNEKTAFHPRSPYGVAKAYAHWINANYREAWGLHTSAGILFNHEGPRRGLEFVSRKITDGVARIATGFADSLALGNLDARRDWGYAGDYVRAMWLMLQQDQPGDYVIATGKAHTVRELAERAFARAGLARQKHVRTDPALYRPAEVDLLLGDSTLAKERLGWTPKVSFEEMVDKMVDADLERCRRAKAAGVVPARE